MRRALGTFLAFALASACVSKEPAPTPTRQALYCAAGEAPCGTGCRPAGSVCCDDGTGRTSSYCEGVTAGCFPKDPTRGCADALAAARGATSAFCCGKDGPVGSVDCPVAQHHCGASCVPLDQPCCEGAACASATTEPSFGCSASGVLCGMCVASAVCRECEPGACCAGDVCANTCVKGDACAASKGAKSGCDSTADCGGGMVCASARRCQAGSAGVCSCAGELGGQCVDFAARGVSVFACGTCGADWSACCPGTLCVGGVCKTGC